MKRHIYIAGTLLLSLATASCGSDYLDTTPTEATSDQAAVSTTAYAYKALNGCAKSMTIQQSYFGQGFCGENAIMRIYENLPSQNYNYNRYASGWADIHNQSMHSNKTTKYDQYAWYYYYQIISQANTIIARIDAAEGDEADKLFIKASALTFRAYAYEKLVHYYCERWQDSDNGASQGMPLRLDESTGDLPFSTLAQTMDQIYADLDEAVKLFGQSGMDRPAGDVWTPNINVAHAVYARAALWKQDYSKAIAEAKAAQDGYPLMNNAAYAAGFCNPTSEWIFGSYGASDENNWYWAYGVQGAANGYYSKAADTGAGSIGHELISRIPDNDVRKGRFMTADKFKSLDLTDQAQVDQSFAEIAPESEDYTEEQKAVNKAVYNEADSLNKLLAVSGLEAPYQSGYYFLDGQYKFFVTDQPGVGYLPYIRSSEMLLIEAEANYFLGKTAEAQAALIALNKDSGRNPEYACSLTGEQLFAEIRDYRCLELWGEGFEWSDFKRWKLPIVRNTVANGGNAHPAVAVTIQPDEANNWVWITPDNETLYNGGLTGGDGTEPQP